MATKDNNTGLLSRMVKFIRKPTQDTQESEVSEMGRESELNKLALKERIERKRQDDAIRRREFNHLRALRNNGPLTGRYVAGQRVDFQSSVGFNPEERALTVKKIDAIEAQLSKHWFELKQNEAAAKSGRPPAPAVAAKASVAPVPGQTPPAPTSVRTEVRAPVPPPSARAAAPVETETVHADLLSNADFDVSRVPPQVVAFMSSRHSVLDSGISNFSNSNLMSVELGEGLEDSGLQEAAIRFADGDVEGAEAVLLSILQADGTPLEAAAACAAALFDLYRATGQQDSFDVVAMDFAQRFGRSPPEWFSTPDLLASKAASLAQRSAAPSGPGGEAAWECPATLEASDVQALQAASASTKTPLQLRWHLLKQIHPDAVQALATLFERWCATPVQLCFSGEAALEKALKLATPAADKRVAPIWWRLRLDALRILNLPDAFEAVAMDFCLLYEVSPPSWVDARCSCAHERDPAGAARAQADGPQADADAPEAVVVELTGEILGDALAALGPLQRGLQGVDSLAISCGKLIRVDFSAAGSILNWVAEREAQGCHIQFLDVPRLVAAFFTVMGINDHARVVVRSK